MWDRGALYFLQPNLDQALYLAALLRREGCDKKLVGVLLPGERLLRKRVYDLSVAVNQYEDIPDDFRIIPAGAASTEAILKRRDFVLGDVSFKANSLLAYDKKKFLELCAHEGLPVPKTYYSLDAVPELSYPIFFKEAHEKGGGVRGVARRPLEVPAHKDGQLIFQEYVDSPGTYGVGFIAHGGELLTSFSHFERESYPQSGGSAVVVERIDDPLLTDLTRRVVKAMNYSGWGLAEFKYSRVSRSYVFMEVNAKFWASCGFAFSSEPEFAKLLFKLDISTSRAQRWFFVNRGLARGFSFMVRNASLLLRSKVIVDPGLVTLLIRSLMPTFVKGVLRRARRA